MLQGGERGKRKGQEGSLIFYVTFGVDTLKRQVMIIKGFYLVMGEGILFNETS